MKSPKYFGRSIALPSKIEIKHDLVMMSLADRLRSELHLKGVTSQDFSYALQALTDNGEISRDMANNIINKFRFHDTETLKP
jgi:hypothetical protein